LAKLIAPSILSADFSRLAAEVKAVGEAGADWIHVDVMDGHFVPNITVGPAVVGSLKKATKLPLDVHLMIENPQYFLEAFAKAGADYLTVHIESTKDPVSLLKKIRELGCRPGITLRPATPLSEIISVLPHVDLVLIMTVNPGFSGQEFMHDQIPKLRDLRKALDKIHSKALIEVDGGINAETAKLCAEADVLVSGNFIFKNNYGESIKALKE